MTSELRETEAGLLSDRLREIAEGHHTEHDKIRLMIKSAEAKERREASRAPHLAPAPEIAVHAKRLREVAAMLAAERMQGWANPLVGVLTDAADAVDGGTAKPAQPEGVVLSALSPVQPAAGAEATDHIPEPGKMVGQDAELVGRLRAQTVKGSNIWPHTLLEEAADCIEADAAAIADRDARIEELTKERDQWKRRWQGRVDENEDISEKLGNALERKDASEAALSEMRAREPDFCYDPDNWEWTQAWEDRAILIDGFGIPELREPKLISTLINGPDKWVVAIPDADDEWEIRWFDSEETARAALGVKP